MKRVLLTIVLYSSLFCLAGCGKGGGSGGGNPAPTEQNLSISLNPDPGTSVASALSDTYSFKLLINSTPPQAGVKIDITGTRESDNVQQFSQTSQTSNSTVKSVDLSVQNLAPGILYVIKIDVTSLTTSTNKASLTFKVARK
jgi:hypothetical protein